VDGAAHSDKLQMALARLRDRAKELFAQGRLAESLAVHEEALRLAPDAVVIRLSAARIAHALELQEVSLGHYEAAVAVDPRCYPAIEAARRIAVGAGLTRRAEHCSALAQNLRSLPESLVAMKLLVPSIMDSHEAIVDSRARYAQGVSELLASPMRLEAPGGEFGVTGFFLAYHGQNDRELQMATARAFLKIIPGLQFTAPHCRTTPPRRLGVRLRVGFISRFFASHSIFSTSVGLIEKLSREQFEVIVLRITPSRSDAATARPLSRP
jgi:predicted O-linked N-acetylglucosamine transferase (SPINDLY family)